MDFEHFTATFAYEYGRMILKFNAMNAISFEVTILSSYVQYCYILIIYFYYWYYHYYNSIINTCHVYIYIYGLGMLRRDITAFEKKTTLFFNIYVYEKLASDCSFRNRFGTKVTTFISFLSMIYINVNIYSVY